MDENQVVALVQGTLGGDELLAAQQHLDGCIDCLDLVGLFQQTTMSASEERDLLPEPAEMPITESEEMNLVAPAGTRIGRYEVIRALGRGGMGVVYLARDPELDRKVALKLVKPSLQSDERADHFERRLMREARAMAKLAHPNVLTIYDVGLHEGQVFLASEWVDGGTLEEWIEDGPHRWHAVVRRFREAAAGLVAAHAAGLVHRDFKPSNVMVGKDERVRVFDFGLVKATTANIGDITTQLSGKFVVGTPAYMAPEQMIGEPADERSDQYSFCASLYEALAGKRPFTGRNLMEILSNIDAGQVDEPRKIPKWLWDMLRRGLHRRPEERYPSMEAVLQVLNKGLRYRRRQTLVAALTVGALGVVAAGGLGYWRDNRPSDALCADARTVLGQAWSQERRLAVKEGILSSATPYADEAWRGAARLFDAYAREWQIQLRSSCMDTRVHKTQSAEVFERRAACFSRLRTELDSVTSRLQDGDEDAVRNAIAMAQGLSPASDCGKQSVLQDSSLPVDSREQEHLAELWPELKAIDTLIVTEQYDQALVEVESLMVKAKGHRPTEARLWASQGAALRMQGKYPEAVRALEKSFYASVAGKYDELAARATADIFEIYAVRLQNPDKAEQWRQLAESAVERADSPAVLGAWRRILGEAALEAHDLDGAERHLLASLEILETELGRHHAEVADTLGGLASCYLRRKELAKSEATQTRAVEIWMATRGPHHPETAMAKIQLASALVEQGKLTEAQELAETAVEHLIRSYGEKHPRVGAALNARAEYAVKAGDFEAANRTLLRALKIKRDVHGSRHIRLVSTLTNLMEVDRMRAQPADGAVHGAEALEILSSHHEGVSNGRIRRLRVGIAESRLAAGALALALEECTALHEEVLGLDEVSPHTRGRIASCAGRAHLAMGKTRQASEWLQRAVDDFGEESAGPRYAVALFSLARIHAGDPDAIRWSKQALDTLATAGPGWANELAEVQAWLREEGGAGPLIPKPE